MPLPKLSQSQIDGVIQQVSKYIESQRQTYKGNASPLERTPEKTDHVRFLILFKRGALPL